MNYECLFAQWRWSYGVLWMNLFSENMSMYNIIFVSNISAFLFPIFYFQRRASRHPLKMLKIPNYHLENYRYEHRPE